MVIYRKDADKEEMGYFFTRFSVSYQLENFSFAGAQYLRFKNDRAIPLHYLDHVIDDRIQEIRRDVRPALPNLGD